MKPSLHRDALEISTRLQHEEVAAFYHFTHVRNLPGICQVQSLCSKQTLEDMGRWPPPVPGGNTLSHGLDRSRGNWNKVSLSLTPHTPMIYHLKREQHLCFLVVDSSVATWSGVVFTDSNAASTNHRRGEGIIGLNNINFNAIRSLPRPGDREGWVIPVQAEVLVPDTIPFEFISKIGFISKASMAHVERLCGSQSKFSVDRRLFLDSHSPFQKIPNFPYVVDLVLTDATVDENNVDLSYNHKRNYSRNHSNRVTVIASVRTQLGTKAEVRWLPNGVTETIQFDRGDLYKHWPHISLSDLPNGECSVEYYLNNQCWASADFEVLE
jgi:hypothetical protein